MSGYVPLNERPQGGHARLLSLTLADGPRDVLDVGCSSGYLAAPLAAAGARVVGIELDPGAAEAARVVLRRRHRRRRRVHGAAARVGVVRRDRVRRPRRAPPRPGDDPRAPPPAAPAGRAARPLHAQRRQLGDAALAARRPVALHRQGNPRPDAHAPLHEEDARRDGGGGRISRARARPHGARPRFGTPAIERAAHAIARVRPSLLAYQFVLAATPR